MFIIVRCDEYPVISDNELACGNILFLSSLHLNSFSRIILRLLLHICNSLLAAFQWQVRRRVVEPGERPRLTRPTYMLIALNRRNRDQHNETDNQLLELSSRFHIIMPPVQPCGPRCTVARRPYVPERLGECIRSGYTSLRHVAAFFCPVWWTRKSLLLRDLDRGTYVHIELYDWPHTLM